jgi:hypothetical protein
MVLSRDEILRAEDLPRVVVDVPEWGGRVILQTMSAARRVQFEEYLAEGDPLLQVKVVAYSLVNEEGQLLFTPADVEGLGEKNFKVIVRLARRAFRLNAMGKEALEEAKENFTETQAGALLSG